MKKIFRIYRRIIKWYFKRKVIHIVRSYQEPLKVNFKTQLNKNTYLGKNVNFNDSTTEIENVDGVIKDIKKEMVRYWKI